VSGRATVPGRGREDFPIAIIGAGFAGIGMAIRLMGPNTGPGHTSVLVFTEAQIAHALAAIRMLRDEGFKYVDIRRDVQDRYNERIQRRMKYMVWSSGCNSWYLSEDGSNHALYPGFAAEYVARARRFKPSEYEIASFQTAAEASGDAEQEGRPGIHC
jgi:hypothetical protein